MDKEEMMAHICCSVISQDIKMLRRSNMEHQKANMTFGILWTSLDGKMAQRKIYNLGQLFSSNRIVILIMPTTFGTLWINVSLRPMVSKAQPPKKLGHTSERPRRLSTGKIYLKYYQKRQQGP